MERAPMESSHLLSSTFRSRCPLVFLNVSNAQSYDPGAAVASFSALPEPMLARSGRLPASGDYAYEVKWDGFRAIVSTEGALRVRSRRGWDMT